MRWLLEQPGPSDWSVSKQWSYGLGRNDVFEPISGVAWFIRARTDNLYS